MPSETHVVLSVRYPWRKNHSSASLASIVTGGATASAVASCCTRAKPFGMTLAFGSWRNWWVHFSVEPVSSSDRAQQECKEAWDIKPMQIRHQCRYNMFLYNTLQYHCQGSSGHWRHHGWLRIPCCRTLLMVVNPCCTCRDADISDPGTWRRHEQVIIWNSVIGESLLLDVLNIQYSICRQAGFWWDPS
jgi:hypothetical protein